MISKLVKAYHEGGLDEVLWRVKKKTRLLGRLQSKYKLGKSIKSVYGVRLTCNYEDATFRMYVAGSYGRYYWDRLSRISRRFIFVDIGANQGLYTLCAARNKANVKCYAFEPNGETFSLLVKNIELNALEKKCEAYKLAISDRVGTACLTVNGNHSGGASLVGGRDEFSAHSSSMNVETIDFHGFDEILGDGDDPIVVKVDVEGFEPIVLVELMKSRHAGRILEVFYEVDERWVNAAELRACLESGGFKDFKIIGGGFHYDVLASRREMPS